MTRFTASEKVMLGRAMAPAAVTRTIAPETVGGALRDLAAAILRPLRRQAISDRLERLDDRLLEDIGIQRFQIDAVAETVSSRQAPGVRCRPWPFCLPRSSRAWRREASGARPIAS
jgi:uncharacterized protein YjiS (DUF1127 family)